MEITIYNHLNIYTSKPKAEFLSTKKWLSGVLNNNQDDGFHDLYFILKILLQLPKSYFEA
jgi:hypothetical protein